MNFAGKKISEVFLFAKINKRTCAVVKPRTLGREVPGSSPPVRVPQSLFVVALSKSHIHSFGGNDQKLIDRLSNKLSK